MSRWFRFYDDVLNDPKVQRLPGDVFKAWVNLLCLASRSGGEIKSVGDVAFALRTTEAKAAAIVTSLATNGLLDRIDGRYFAPHNWQGRQFKSDVSNERVQRHRKRQRNVTEAVTETPPETDTEAETEQKEDTPSLRSGVARKRATRLPDDFALNDELIEFSNKYGFAGDELQAVFADFCDYWRAKAGAAGVKLDWVATWRRWIRTEADKRKNQRARNGTNRRTVHDAAADLHHRLKSLDEPAPSDLRGGEGARPVRLISSG